MSQNLNRKCVRTCKICINHQVINNKISFGINCLGCGVIAVNSEYCSFKPMANEFKMEIPTLKLIDDAKQENTKIKKTLRVEYLYKRSTMLDYLDYLKNKNNVSLSTFSLAVHLIDYLMQNFEDLNQDLTVISCFLLAAKYNERDPYIQSTHDFKSINKQRYYTSNEVKRYEIVCLMLLDYKLNTITTYNILECFLGSGIILKDELKLIYANKFTDQQSNYPAPSVNDDQLLGLVDQIYQRALTLIEMISKLDIYINYHPLTLVCSVITILRSEFKLTNNWNSWLSSIYMIEYESFKNCESVLKAEIENLQKKKSSQNLYSNYNTENNNYLKKSYNNIYSTLDTNQDFKHQALKGGPTTNEVKQRESLNLSEINTNIDQASNYGTKAAANPGTNNLNHINSRNKILSINNSSSVYTKPKPQRTLVFETEEVLKSYKNQNLYDKERDSLSGFGTNKTVQYQKINNLNNLNSTSQNLVREEKTVIVKKPYMQKTIQGSTNVNSNNRTKSTSINQYSGLLNVSCSVLPRNDLSNHALENSQSHSNSKNNNNQMKKQINYSTLLTSSGYYPNSNIGAKISPQEESSSFTEENPHKDQLFYDISSAQEANPSLIRNNNYHQSKNSISTSHLIPHNRDDNIHQKKQFVPTNVNSRNYQSNSIKGSETMEYHNQKELASYSIDGDDKYKTYLSTLNHNHKGKEIINKTYSNINEDIKDKIQFNVNLNITGTNIKAPIYFDNKQIKHPIKIFNKVGGKDYLTTDVPKKANEEAGSKGSSRLNTDIGQNVNTKGIYMGKIKRIEDEKEKTTTQRTSINLYNTSNSSVEVTKSGLSEKATGKSQMTSSANITKKQNLGNISNLGANYSTNNNSSSVHINLPKKQVDLRYGSSTQIAKPSLKPNK